MSFLPKWHNTVIPLTDIHVPLICLFCPFYSITLYPCWPSPNWLSRSAPSLYSISHNPINNCPQSNLGPANWVKTFVYCWTTMVSLDHTLTMEYNISNLDNGYWNTLVTWQMVCYWPLSGQWKLDILLSWVNTGHISDIETVEGQSQASKSHDHDQQWTDYVMT